MEKAYYYNTKYMGINIYVHHMDVDALFDYINERTEEPPEYWINPRDLPHSISGGYLQIVLDYYSYTLIREVKEHNTFSDL